MKIKGSWTVWRRKIKRKTERRKSSKRKKAKVNTRNIRRDPLPHPPARLQEAAVRVRLTAEIKQHKRRCILRKGKKTRFQRLAAAAAAAIQKEKQRPGSKKFLKISPVVTVTRTEMGRSTDF